MKWAWYRVMHLYVTIGLWFYFSKIIVRGRDNIPRSGPVIFLANHQNALLDALLVATTNRRHTHFLARADLFNNVFVRFLLSTINMKPIYRVRDGWSTLRQNGMTFDYCEKVLTLGHGLLLFPEGNHDLKRRLRPLSKGFIRIIEHALKANHGLELKIVPVGINYASHQRVWSGVSIYYGKPISLKNFLVTNDLKSLREEVSSNMKRLITHIDSVEQYDSHIHFLESQQVDFLNPEMANHLLKKSLEKKSDLKNPQRRTPGIWLIPLLFNFLPGLVWILIKRRIKDPVFVSTARFAVTISLFPTHLFLQGAIIWMASPIAAIGVTATSIISLPVYGYLQGKG